LQFNNAGSFGGIPNVTYSGGKVNLGNVANVKMTGNLVDIFLSTGRCWKYVLGLQVQVVQRGTNQMVQYNDAGSFGGDVGFTYDSGTNILSGTFN
jgi:hypothetical protein